MPIRVKWLREGWSYLNKNRLFSPLCSADLRFTSSALRTTVYSLHISMPDQNSTETQLTGCFFRIFVQKVFEVNLNFRYHQLKNWKNKDTLVKFWSWYNITAFFFVSYITCWHLKLRFVLNIFWSKIYKGCHNTKEGTKAIPANPPLIMTSFTPQVKLWPIW